MNRLIRSALVLALALVAMPAWAQKTSTPQPMAAPGESTEPPPPKAAPVPVVQQHALAPGGGVLVFGGAEGPSLELVKVLIANHTHVTVVTDDSAADATLAAMGATAVHGDARDPESIKSIFTSTPIRAVVSMNGAEHGAAARDFTDNKNVVDISKAAHIPRLILVSPIGAGNSGGAPPWYVKVAMRVLDYRAVTEMTQAEDYLRQSGVNYTIVRSGGMADEPASGKAVLTNDSGVYSQIAPADLADVLAACVDDDTAGGKTLSAFDPTRK